MGRFEQNGNATHFGMDSEAVDRLSIIVLIAYEVFIELKSPFQRVRGTVAVRWWSIVFPSSLPMLESDAEIVQRVKSTSLACKKTYRAYTGGAIRTSYMSCLFIIAQFNA